jgi:hypothetical protein
LHVPGDAFFNPFSDLAVPVPGKPKVIKELTKLMIIHKLKGNKTTPNVRVWAFIITTPMWHKHHEKAS